MSDDEGPRGKGGKGKKGGGKGGGGGGGGGKSGGKGGKAGERGRMSVSRLQVLPKFLQDIHAKYKPAEDKRGLQHAELLDKSSPLGMGSGYVSKCGIRGPKKGNMLLWVPVSINPANGYPQEPNAQHWFL